MQPDRRRLGEGPEEWKIRDAPGARGLRLDSDIGDLELRHRRHARVADAIRVGKETGMRTMPFAAFEHNAAWLEISLAAQALLRWVARLCLLGELALAEPRRVRQRLLHLAGRLVRSGRRVALRLPRTRRTTPRTAPGRFRGTVLALLPTSSQPITPFEAKTVDRG